MSTALRAEGLNRGAWVWPTDSLEGRLPMLVSQQHRPHEATPRRLQPVDVDESESQDTSPLPPIWTRNSGGPYRLCSRGNEGELSVSYGLSLALRDDPVFRILAQAYSKRQRAHTVVVQSSRR